MKKILTVSLIAMMAVSAARADIASTKYVDDKTGDVAASDYVSGLTNKTLTGAVENLNSRIDDISGESGILAELDLTTVTETGKAIVSVSQENGQVSATVGEITNAGIAANAGIEKSKLASDVQASLGKADSAMQSIEAGTVTKAMLESTVQTSLGKADTAMQSIGAGTVTKTMLDSDVQASLDAADAAAGGITTAIEALDVTDTAVEKQFVTAVSETDGKVVVSRAALTAADIPTIEQSQVNGLGAALSGKQATLGAGDITTGLIADANVTKAKLSTDVQASLNKADTAMQSIEAGTVTKAMLESTVQTSLGLADSALQEADISDMQLKSNIETNIAHTLTGEQANQKYTSVSYVDTKVKSIDTGLGTLQTDVTQNKNNISGLTTKVQGMDLPEVKSEGMAIVSISETDGKVSATTGTITNAGIAADAGIEQSKIAGLAASLTGATNAALQGIADATTGTTDGVWTLTMKVAGDTKTFGWELISR